MSVKIINDLASFKSIQEDWDRLYELNEHLTVFSSWHWNYNWYETIGKNEGELFLVVVSNKEGLPVGIAPLSLKKRGRKSVLSFLNDDYVADYSDFIFDNTFADYFFNELFATLNEHKKMWSQIELSRVRNDSLSFEQLEKYLGKSNGVSSFICHAPVLKIEEDWESFFPKLSKKLRQELRTTKNKIKKEFNCEPVFIDHDQKEDLYKSLVKFHVSRQENKVGTSFFLEEELSSFYKRLIDDLSPVSETNISGIIIDDKVVSVVMGFKDRDHFRYWIPSFDSAIRIGSLGKLHLSYLVESSFLNEMKGFDLMIGVENYKLKWANESVDCFQFNYFKRPMDRLLFETKNDLKEKVKPMVKQNKILNSLYRKLSKHGS
ncbi:GNAT family N-acetyltransferase [Halobacteriovorax sp. GB3]|uniref:GNAT family N-acetyltransferase n=1 Tax=Halobacteriovorax sp. GB3 TaxID=2719615 RepID=UPI002361DC70|nr:GNAT family N-acetyltransferase [Halobacteriovorax sp. GB3]MDD0852516.1 GNAT family N-acetyltransferase [Halobacteriovorax sp. GB3]